ncbi:LysR substrate binding domain [Pantoea agglomerans]|uniref:LysR substrate binding domain n=1 Tax=Enterobacter agglomerans TaxID=549 RepID=A0A379AG31_ENTAG|nr:LysR substrate binding domain [Pantoea agglomerans]
MPVSIHCAVSRVGQLRIDVGGSTARDVLIPLLPDFFARYPDITLDLGVSESPGQSY